MKKLFVSVPMKGRTEEEIKESIQKMKKMYGTWARALRNWHGLMYLLEYARATIGTAVALKEKQQKNMALKHI